MQRLIIRRSVGVNVSFLGEYVVKFHASKFFLILLMMDISKINRSQHENRNFHIFGINIKAQSEFSHMNSLIPFLIHGPYHKGPLLIRLPPASAG